MTTVEIDVTDDGTELVRQRRTEPKRLSVLAEWTSHRIRLRRRRLDFRCVRATTAGDYQLDLGAG